MMKIDPIQRLDTTTNRVLVRNGITLAFFLDRLLYENSDEVIAVLDLFVETIPVEAMKWALVSATADEWREVNAAVMKRMRDSLRPPGVRRRKLTAFHISDAEGDAPQYSFKVLDGIKDEDSPEARTLVQMTFPPAALDENQVDRTFDLVVAMARLLKPDYGYCAPGLLTSESEQSAAYAMTRSIALRHPGYDVEINEMSQMTIGTRVRGARWTTFLGPLLAQQLGGIGALRAALPPEVDVSDLGGVVVIRAGRVPELGDINRKQNTPLLRAVARLLEPVTLFGEIDMLSYFADFDESLLQRWERRFLD